MISVTLKVLLKRNPKPALAHALEAGLVTAVRAANPLSVVDDNGVKGGGFDRAAIVNFLVSSSRRQQ